MQYHLMKQGIYTANSPQISELAQELSNTAKSKGKSFLRAVTDHIRQNLPRNAEQKEDLFRKRTADQIITSGFVTGCTDEALVFLSLARQNNIPAVYVETLERSSLSTENAGKRGHIFTNIYDEEQQKWRIYEVSNGFQEEYTFQGGIYIPIAMGMDFSAVYIIQNKQEVAREDTALDSEQALIEIAPKAINNIGNITFDAFGAKQIPTSPFPALSR